MSLTFHNRLFNTCRLDSIINITIAIPKNLQLGLKMLNTINICNSPGNINGKIKTTRIVLNVMLTEIGLDGELNSVISAGGETKGGAEV